MSYLGKNIRRYRKLRKLTITELAKLSNVGVSSISQIETGKRDPSFKVILSIAQGLKVDITELVSSPDEQIFQHKIDLLISFSDENRLIIGNSKNNSDYYFSWGLIIDNNQNFKNEMYFKTNAEGYLIQKFYTEELKDFLEGQRLRILVGRGINIEMTLEKAMDSGISWDHLIQIIWQFQDNSYYMSKESLDGFNS